MFWYKKTPIHDYDNLKARIEKLEKQITNNKIAEIYIKNYKDEIEKLIKKNEKLTFRNEILEEIQKCKCRC